MVDETRVDDYRDLLRESAALRIAYRLVPVEEVEAFAASRHHEGICVLARAPRASLRHWSDEVDRSPCLVALDGVRNPHNLGAVTRSAAHFGVSAIIRESRDGRWTGAAFRTAEGGAEAVDRISIPALADGLRSLARAGYAVLGLDGTARRSLYDMALSGPTVLVLGSEADGLSTPVRATLSQTVRLPGTGRVESLNVSNAAAVSFAEMWRQRHLGSIKSR